MAGYPMKSLESHLIPSVTYRNDRLVKLSLNSLLPLPYNNTSSKNVSFPISEVQICLRAHFKVYTL